jgi:hypothetical protein
MRERVFEYRVRGVGDTVALADDLIHWRIRSIFRVMFSGAAGGQEEKSSSP